VRTLALQREKGLKRGSHDCDAIRYKLERAYMFIHARVFPQRELLTVSVFSAITRDARVIFTLRRLLRTTVGFSELVKNLLERLSASISERY